MYIFDTTIKDEEIIDSLRSKGVDISFSFYSGMHVCMFQTQLYMYCGTGLTRHVAFKKAYGWFNDKEGTRLGTGGELNASNRYQEIRF